MRCGSPRARDSTDLRGPSPWSASRTVSPVSRQSELCVGSRRSPTRCPCRCGTRSSKRRASASSADQRRRGPPEELQLARRRAGVSRPQLMTSPRHGQRGAARARRLGRMAGRGRDDRGRRRGRDLRPHGARRPQLRGRRHRGPQQCPDGQHRRERRRESKEAVALFSLEMSESELRSVIASQASYRATSCEGKVPLRPLAEDRPGHQPARRARSTSTTRATSSARRAGQGAPLAQNAARPRPSSIDYLQLMRRDGRPRTAWSRSARSPAASRRSPASSTSP